MLSLNTIQKFNFKLHGFRIFKLLVLHQNEVKVKLLLKVSYSIFKIFSSLLSCWSNNTTCYYKKSCKMIYTGNIGVDIPQYKNLVSN